VERNCPGCAVDLAMMAAQLGQFWIAGPSRGGIASVGTPAGEVGGGVGRAGGLP